ncbi:twin-arginine translocase TatA/TatE family subunit [Desulforamulus aquiferis]|uniref:Sec-independent protein translocase protein TatA n=1 Tax=Desulforamulus aquiferis TaxID=1397668 RepID=A0AAW7ZAQ7_9FIRM|nr:twin-arginine translocase TatA/TatE family subunit [Desulforamulus aquiferis]MDO7786447.1 twin-arginine translocase TatA/TatE family subunit [Desulforamulus aquiferis]RYD02559.1 hypothetical protein N752_24840 [Desulforamulus aquiferis]
MRVFFEGIFQPTHILLILVVVLIVFGPGKLPEVGKAVGKTIGEFRRAASQVNFDLEEPKKEKKEDNKEEPKDSKPS